MISFLLSVVIFLPMVVSLVLNLIIKKRSFMIDASLPTFSLSLLMFITLVFYNLRLPIVEIGIFATSLFEIGYLLDYFSLSVSFIVLLISSIVAFYSLSYFKEDKKQHRFWFWFNVFVSSMLFLVFSDNLLSTFIGWEAIGICSWALISYYYDSTENSTNKMFVSLGEQSTYASLKALLYTSISDVFLLAFVGIVYFLTYENGSPTLNYTSLQQALSPVYKNSNIMVALSLLLILGIIGKAAQLPLSSWLPDAMVAPTPVSALLHSATVVKAPLVLIGRLLILDPFLITNPTFQFSATIITLITIAISSIGAIVENDIKRLLAYSTISQIGFVLLGLSLSQDLITTWSSIFQLLSHAILKATLFLFAGVAIHTYGSNKLEEIKIGVRENKLLFLSVIASIFSLVGFPPFSGFLSKELLLHSIESYSTVIYILALALSLLTPIYSFKLLSVFTIKDTLREEKTKEVKNMSLFTFILSFFTLILNVVFLALASIMNLSMDLSFLFSWGCLLTLVLFVAVSLLAIVSFKTKHNMLSSTFTIFNQLTVREGLSFYVFSKAFTKACKKFSKIETLSTSFYVFLVLFGLLMYILIMLVTAIK